MTTAGNTQNYFKLFGFPELYDLDLTELSSRFRTLQSVIHPDKFASASDLERRMSVQKSALINEAYQTLGNPLERARYMLKLKGVDLSNETSTAMDTEFLMQQMQLREDLEQVRHSDSPITVLENISTEIDGVITTQKLTLKELFASEDDNLEPLVDYVRRMQFMFKLKEEAELLEEELV